MVWSFPWLFVTRYLNISETMKLLKTVGTHNGTFHCDEVLGCSMLKLLFPDIQIVRSRNDDILKDCDIVIDVGGKYEPENYLFDHHQKTFNHTMNSLLPNKKYAIKLSSAGLVYCHFGKDILKAVHPNLSEKEIDGIFDKVYEGFVQEIDAIDNGIPICDGGVEKYWISTHLSARVSKLNRSWTTPESEFNETEAFNTAMEMVTKEFLNKVKGLVNEWLPAKAIVENSINKRYETHSSGEIIILDTFCPWKAHLFSLEEELNIKPGIKYVLFRDGNTWRVQAVSKTETSFELRVPLYHSWTGLREEELSKVSGIEGTIFVHSSGFIGGNKTKEGAMQMAIKSLELSKDL